MRHVSPKLAALIAQARSLALESAIGALTMRVDMFESWAERRRLDSQEASDEIWSRGEEGEEGSDQAA